MKETEETTITEVLAEIATLLNGLRSAAGDIAKRLAYAQGRVQRTEIEARRHKGANRCGN